MKRLVGIPREFLVAFIAIVMAVAVPVIAVATTATTTSIIASPSPAAEGQSVTFTATASAPGTVTFTYDGQMIGTATTTGAAATASGFTQWQYTGNSLAHRIATNPASSNIFVSTWNPDDCGGGRCQTKQLSPGGGVSYAPNESWNGFYVSVTGLAVDSNGAIYEGIFNGIAQNTIRKRTSIGATSTQFVSSSSICGTCAAGSNYITGMTIDANDNLYVTNSREGKILKVTPAGVVSTYASGLGSPIAGPVINRTTGVLYYIDGNQDIRQIPSGGGASTLLAAASCNIDANPGSPWFGNGGQLALDSSGFIYGAQCGGVTPTSTPNNSPITQVNPTSGAMREYMSWTTCMNGSLPGWAASCGGNNALAFAGGTMYTGTANMGVSAVIGMNPSGYVATLAWTPPAAGSFGFGASLAPTNSGSFTGSSGSGTLQVRPVAPQAPDLASASDTGTSSTDDRTNDNTPRIEVPGTYAAGDTITVTATKAGSSNVTCTYVIPATGCDLGTLADGVWSITATDTHPTGGASAASTALSITVDTAAPSAPTAVDLAMASDSGTSSTDNVTSDNTPTMSASGGSAGDTMTLTATKSGSADVSCSYVLPATNCTMGTMEDGTWGVRATLTDAAGNVSAQSAALNVTVDTTGPGALTPDLLAASDLGNSNSDNVTSDNTPSITIPGQATGDVITITAARSGFTSVTCSYTVGGTTNCTLGTLAEGVWSVTASVADLAGNSGTTLALNITVDTSAPTAPTGVDLAASSDLGTSSTDNLTSDTTPTVSASGGAAGDTMTLTASRSGQTNVTCSYVLPASSCDLGTLSDGVWAVSATLTDPAGNTSPVSTPLSLVIDSTPPPGPGAPSVASASDTGSSNSDGVTSDTTPEIVVPGATTGDTITVSATQGGTTVTCTFVAGPGVNSCTLPAIGPGDWSIVASSNAVDAAGNTAPPSSPTGITIDTSNAAPGVPDLTPASDTGPSSTDDVTKDTQPVIDVPGVEPGSTVTVVASQPGRPDVTCTFVASTTVTGCKLPFLADGTWNIVASSVDPAGNPSLPSSPLRIFLDTAPPPPPPTPVVPSKGDVPVVGPVQDLGGDDRPIVGVDGGTPGDTITVSATDGTRVITCSFVVGQATRCRLPALPPGTWTITATATDPAGNVSIPSGSISVRVAAKTVAEKAKTKGKPVLKLTAMTSRRVLRPRDRAVITLRARNTGKVTARNVVMRLTIPKGLAVVGQQALATGDARATFRMASLAPGKAVARQVTLVALSNGVGTAAAVRARLSATSATPRSVGLVHRIATPSGAKRGTAPVTG